MNAPRKVSKTQRTATKARRPALKASVPGNPRGRPRKYSDELLIEAALRVMGRDGYTGLTIRALAQELGISHSALYTYVSAIKEIEDKAVQRLTDQLAPPRSSAAPALRKELMAYLMSIRVLLLLHPGVVLSRQGSPTSEIFRDISERWNRALLAHAPNLRTVELALGALIATVLLIVEGERMLDADPASQRSRRTLLSKPSADTFRKLGVEQYLNELIDLVLPGLAIGNKGRKPASRRSSK